MAGGNLIPEGFRGAGATGGDFFFEAARGSVPNTESFILGACNTNVTTTEQTLWGFGGIYTYITTPVELFVSSSNAIDAFQIITVSGLRSFDGVIETGIVFSNGQTQVSVGLWYRIFTVRNLGFLTGGGGFVGDFYLAQAGTWTAGVPDTATDVKGFIGFSVALGRSPNVFNFPGFTPPIDRFALVTHLDFAAPKGQDVTFATLIRPNPGVEIVPFQDVAPYNAFQSSVDLKFNGIFVGEMWDLEIRARTGAGTASVTAIIQGFLIEQGS